MSETAQQIPIRRSPLDGAHARLGAVMTQKGERHLPSSYGDMAAEYSVVRDGGGGMIDLSSRGRIEVKGSEAVQFLNGLITNDVKTLEVGAWMHAAFPNVQGRLLANTRVLQLEKDRFLFDMEAANHDRVMKTLGRFTLAGDFQVTDLMDEFALISLQGGRAAEIIAATIGAEAATTKRRRLTTLLWEDHPLHVIRATHTGEDGFDLFVSASKAASLWNALEVSCARPVGFDALEVLRIEAGLPLFGIDMDETNVVLEAVADDAVSFTKGCYIGQEIIARIHWRGHVAKKLTGIILDAEGEGEGEGEPKREDKIRSVEGKEIGRLTSTAFSPRLGKVVALGYVKFDYLAPETEVRIVSGEVEHPARVAKLPLVRGSWDEPPVDSVEARA